MLSNFSMFIISHCIGDVSGALCDDNVSVLVCLKYNCSSISSSKLQTFFNCALIEVNTNNYCMQMTVHII